MERDLVRGRGQTDEATPIKILYTNAQSLFSKLEELVAVAELLQPDVVLLTETWTNGSISDAMIQIPGYRIEGRKDRQDTKNGVGGGLVFYVKDCYQIIPGTEDLGDFNQYSTLTLSSKCGPLNLILIYRPPNSNAANFSSLVQLIENTKQNTIIIGDFNMPGIDWEEERAVGQGKILLDVMTAQGLEQMVGFPTHKKGNILDLILTNCPEKFVSVTEAGCLGTSDHCIIMAEIESVLPKNKTVTRLNWRKGDFQAIRDELRTTDWDILHTGSLSEAWNIFKHRLTALVSRYIPRITVKGAGRPRWLNCELKKLLTKKKNAWRKYRREGGSENKEAYDEIAKRLKKQIRNAKRNVEKKLAFGNDKNSRQFNNYIKSKTKSRAPVGQIKKSDGTVVTEDVEMADELNGFFASVFTKEDLSQIPEKNLETDQVLNTVTITAGKVIAKIKDLRADSAAGPDEIHPRLLKETMYEVAGPLVTLFKRSMDENCIPTDWKSAIVTPIFKKGSRSDPGNYRPVSLTSVLCKLLESIIKDEVTSHLETNNLIRDSQHGFMKGRSCATNVIEFLEVVTRAIDCGESVDVFYLDFSKAFDKVPRERLMVKVRAKGISGPLADWLHNWLSDRKQAVRVGNDLSGEEDVGSGVPQGTVLGPCLFKIHIDDLDEIVERLVDLLSKFADDTKGVKIIRNINDALQLQEALNKLAEWAQKWGMCFNEQKCKVMHVGKNNPQYEYSMNGVKLKVVEEEKDVGITIHKNLKPGRHCERVAATATGILRQLAKSFHYRDKRVFLRLYTQHVRPHLEFATPAWSPWLTADIQKIEKVQEKAVKMISGLKGASYEEKCSEVGLETLEKCRKIQDMAQTYKLVHGIDNVSRINLLNHVPEGRTRLAADPLNLRSGQSRTDVRKHFFTQRIVSEWNNIPSENKNSANVYAFKTNYRQYTSTDGMP
jgi:Reverse transcriptase (RNA-dependent DNA polymerase)/Endonuclease-reverse transcriptase